MNLELNISCYHYERRLCWMLSSILQQRGNIPNILISLAHVPGTGDPDSSKVIEFFQKQGLQILSIPLGFDTIKNRAIVRSKRLQETTADWILFADSDMVYAPMFFDDLSKKIQTERYNKETLVIGAPRHSLQGKFCVDYFSKDTMQYPLVVENVADKVSKWPVQWITDGATAAGYFQLANMKSVRERKVVYSKRPRDLWRSTKSDREFRIHMGGRTSIETLAQYHLNHDRKGAEIQR